MRTKLCTRCKVTKTEYQFYIAYVNSKGTKVLSSKCKTCKKEFELERHKNKTSTELDSKRAKAYENRWLRETGLTVSYSDVQEAIDNQNNACAICKDYISFEEQYFHYDHNHSNQKLREVLCPPCNRGLGCFDDDPTLLLKAINYLRKHST